MNALKVALNAVALAPGGGLQVLLGYLQTWQEIEAELQVTVFASRKEVLDPVRESCPNVRVIGFAEGQRPAQRFARQQVILGRQIERAGAEVIMTTNSLVGRTRLPQLVHHQNLLRFLGPSIWPGARRGRFGEAARDIAARQAVRHSTINVFVSEFLRQAAERYIPESGPRNYVVHNGVSIAATNTIARRAPTEGRNAHLMAVQTPARHKDTATLIRILAHLIKAQPAVPWRLTVAGAGDWSTHRILATELGVGDRVTFPGYLSRNELYSMLSNSLCLVFPSLLEAFGMPLIEAMACGCPVVASNTTAIPEVAGANCLLVEPGRHIQFAEAILRLTQDDDLRSDLIRKGLQRAAAFSWENSAERMAGLLRFAAQIA